MSRALPQSLFGQTLLILLAGLVASLSVGAWIYSGDRGRAVRAVGGLAVAQRMANLARLVEEAPPDWRQRIVAASSDPSFRVSLAPQPAALPAAGEEPPISRVIEDYLADALPSRPARQVRVAVDAVASPPFAAMHDHPMRMRAAMHAAGAWRGLQASVQLLDGDWLSFATALPDTGPVASWQLVLSIAAMAGVIVVVSAWAVRRLTRPLGDIAVAAERLGKDMGAPPLAEAGSIEMRRAARAFNDMQDRLRRIVENRTRMLASISHDLRTPLTLLRLRAETVENADERDRMLATIADMSGIIEATLGFARDEVAAEPRRRTDLGALLASVVDDLADAGMTVTMEQAAPVIYDCRPATMKRAMLNLIDNALKYGKAARVAIRTAPRRIDVIVDDDGPGIPEHELTRVLQPFYRLEGSRSRDTGGIGLGLAIALSIIEAHGGELTLANRSEGGLRARITLPR